MSKNKMFTPERLSMLVLAIAMLIFAIVMALCNRSGGTDAPVSAEASTAIESLRSESVLDTIKSSKSKKKKKKSSKKSGSSKKSRSSKKSSGSSQSSFERSHLDEEAN